MRTDSSCNVALARGKTSWGAHQAGHVEFVHNQLTVVLPISYDERLAPYVPGDNTLISLADEGDCCVCAWMEHTPKSNVAGLGVDLVSPQYFELRSSAKSLANHIFSSHEHALAPSLCGNDLPFAYAVLFGAKEAAFKATARPLRQWYATHNEPLRFEVRDFGMVEPGLMRGELRRHAAQHALDAMGICRIEVEWKTLDGMALVVAYAMTA